MVNREFSVVIDSGSSLDLTSADSLGLNLVPLLIVDGFGQDASDIPPDQLYQRMLNDERFSTSQPSAESFLKMYRQLFADGSRIIFSVHPSEKLSGTVNQARLARDRMMLEQPEMSVVVVDSLGVSAAQQIVAISALSLLEKGLDPIDAEEELIELASMIKLYAAFDTVKFLDRGGRVASITKNIARVLNIKPLISLQQGELSLAGKSRTAKGLMAEMIDNLKSDVQEHGWPEEIKVFFTNDSTMAEQLILAVQQIPGSERVKFSTPFEAGAVIGVHAGPNAFGMSYLPGKS